MCEWTVKEWIWNQLLHALNFSIRVQFDTSRPRENSKKVIHLVISYACVYPEFKDQLKTYLLIKRILKDFKLSPVFREYIRETSRTKNLGGDWLLLLSFQLQCSHVEITNTVSVNKLKFDSFWSQQSTHIIDSNRRSWVEPDFILR